MTQSYFTAPLDTPVAPAPGSLPGWDRFFELEGGFQLFLLAEMVVYPSAAKVLHDEFFVAADLVHKHTAYDVNWDAPSTIAENDLHRWYPLERLPAHFVPHLLAAELANRPSDAALFEGMVHVRKRLIEPYTSGDTDWLDYWPEPAP